jgi:hypothetical protein
VLVHLKVARVKSFTKKFRLGKATTIVKEQKLERAEQAVELLKTAAHLNLNTPYRTGATLAFPLKGELMVVADIHGNRKNFQGVVEVADLGKNPQRHLLFLGDIIHSLEALKSGKDFSCLLVEDLAALKIQFPEQVHLLLGNHELSEFLGRTIFKEGQMLNFLFTRGLHISYGEKGAVLVRKALNTFFQTLPVIARTQTGIMISHSTPEADFLHAFDSLFFQKEISYRNQGKVRKIEEFIWGRDFSSKTAERLAQKWQAEIFIVGHEKCQEGFEVPNPYHIILDSTDEYGVYLLLKLHQPYAQKGIIRQIQFIQETSPRFSTVLPNLHHSS